MKCTHLSKWQLFEKAIEGEVEAEKATYEEWSFIVGPGTELFDRLSEMPVRLEHETSRIFQGLKTSADKIYTLEERGTAADGIVTIYSRSLEKELGLEAAPLKPLLSGKHVRRYATLETRQLLLFPYGVSDGKAELIPADKFEQDYPRCWAYLQENRNALEDRENGKMRHERWYGYV